MRVKWEVEDGYVGKSRPQYTDIPDDEIAEYETIEGKRDFIDSMVQEDFEQTITWSYDCDIESMISEVSHK